MSPEIVSLRPGPWRPHDLLRRDAADRLAALQAAELRPGREPERRPPAPDRRRRGARSRRGRRRTPRRGARPEPARSGSHRARAPRPAPARPRRAEADAAGGAHHDRQQLPEAARSVDRQRRLAPAQIEGLQQSRQPEPVVGVEVRDEHLRRDRAGRPSAAADAGCPHRSRPGSGRRRGGRGSPAGHGAGWASSRRCRRRRPRDPSPPVCQRLPCPDSSACGAGCSLRGLQAALPSANRPRFTRARRCQRSGTPAPAALGCSGCISLHGRGGGDRAAGPVRGRQQHAARAGSSHQREGRRRSSTRRRRSSTPSSRRHRSSTSLRRWRRWPRSACDLRLHDAADRLRPDRRARCTRPCVSPSRTASASHVAFRCSALRAQHELSVRGRRRPHDAHASPTAGTTRRRIPATTLRSACAARSESHLGSGPGRRTLRIGGFSARVPATARRHRSGGSEGEPDRRPPAFHDAERDRRRRVPAADDEAHHRPEAEHRGRADEVQARYGGLEARAEQG